MRLGLYFDEDSQDRHLVAALRARGVEVTTAFEAQLIERNDQEQLEWAAEHERALYSFNVGHFYRLHCGWVSQGKPHAGIILAQRQRYSVGEQMRRLLKLIANRSSEQMKNQVEFLSAWG